MMKNDQFVYVTYIRTTPEKLWKALTEPEFTRKPLTSVAFDELEKFLENVETRSRQTSAL